jgi:hypothetical protein
LHQPTNILNSVLHWFKSYEVMHKFLEKFVLQSTYTAYWHFLPCCIDVINTHQNVEHQ